MTIAIFVSYMLPMSGSGNSSQALRALKHEANVETEEDDRIVPGTRLDRGIREALGLSKIFHAPVSAHHSASDRFVRQE